MRCAYQLCSCPKARVIFRKPLSRDNMTRNGRSRTFQDNSKNRNSFADLARAAHRVLSSGFGRRTRLMSPNRFL
eukprot:3417328-Pyramimonas_sp.AAC.1